MAGNFLASILEHKRREVEQAQRTLPEATLRERAQAPREARPFLERLASPGPHGLNIVAEIKRASPSKGIIRADLDPAAYAQAYERGGAAALSVLTDERYFHGGADDLRAARAATRLPVLRKDFLISTYQVYESAAMGADAVLLIARLLSPDLLRDCMHLGAELALDALVEVHSREDFDKANAVGARLIGINTRDLSSFQTDFSVAVNLRRHLQPHQIPLAESGIRSRTDVEGLLQLGLWNFLVGESLVRAPDPESFLRHLLGSTRAEPASRAKRQ